LREAIVSSCKNKKLHVIFST